MLSQSDREAFSLAIINDASQISGLQMSMAALQPQEAKDQALDTANTNLFTDVNPLINEYQAEYNLIDGNLRTSITEQNILDSANRIVGNFFFPNSTTLSIPSLSAQNNIWLVTTPFALAYGLGQNYNQTYTTGTAENTLISNIQALITSAGSYSNINLTSGQWCVDGGTCSIPMYTNEVDCLAHSGVWTPTETIENYPAVQTLGANLASAVNSLVTQLNLEVTALNAISDPNSTNQAQNTAALAYINSTLLPALNTWLAYPTFNPTSGLSTCAAFNSYPASSLAPTQLYSTQLAALSSAINARATFLSTTRTSQLNTVLGTITQNITTGLFSGSGLYFNRFNFMNLRLNLLTGSLTILTSDQQVLSTQTTMIANLNQQIATYQSVCPTVLLSASGNGTPVVSLASSVGFNVGDTVYIASNSQPELQFAVKSINGSSMNLSSLLPTKYTTLDQVRIYRDAT